MGPIIVVLDEGMGKSMTRLDRGRKTSTALIFDQEGPDGRSRNTGSKDKQDRQMIGCQSSIGVDGARPR